MNIESAHAIRSYRSPVRVARKEATRKQILDAIAGRLESGNFDSLSMEAIAAIAGVGVATLYRNFPSRDALLDALSEQYFNERLGGLPFPKRADDIGPIMRRSINAFAHDSRFVRSFLSTQLGRLARSRGRTRRIESIRSALEPVMAGLPSSKKGGRTAVIAYLASIQAWATMTTEFDITGGEAGEAIEWAIDNLIAQIERETTVGHQDKT